jgi:murein DD-endopeptidase MepM/ murein hydrolase activator NlpD
MATIDSHIPNTTTGRRAWADSLESAIAGCIGWITTSAWQATSEGAQAVIARFGAHLIVVGMAALAVILSGVQLPARERDVATPMLALIPAPSVNLGNRADTALLDVTTRGGPRLSNDESLVARAASPLTPYINRPRKDVISYTIQAGDTMFGIAQQFNLQPESILWANPELKDNPDLLSVGMEIAVLPVDGVLHTVQKGDTLDSIAKKYKVTPEAIVTAVWNNLIPGQDLPVGKSIIVPGGKREMVVWQLPAANKPAPASTGVGGWSNAGQCLNVSAKALGTGKFGWPTNAHWVSGNPYAWWHRGVDLAGDLGDPVYAADTGTVLWAGPNSWGYGNMILLDHGNGWQTLYAHLSQIYVHCGQQIVKGATIGAVGSTGRSTGPHLHFETRFNGDLPNPLNSLPNP